MEDDSLNRPIDGQVLVPYVREAQVHLDVFRSDRDDGKITAMRSEHVSGRDNPGWGEESAAAKPAIFRDTGHILY